jgi:hypothetical protein
MARGRSSEIAAPDVSPVRIRITSARFVTKILPSPTWPVRAVDMIFAITAWASSSPTTTSIFTLGRKSTEYSAPR